MDLQSRYEPRDHDTLSSFYQTSVTQETVSSMSKMYQKRLDQLSMTEKHRTNIIEKSRDFKGTLRDCHMTLCQTSTNNPH
jgi:hypothetical protein